MRKQLRTCCLPVALLAATGVILSGCTPKEPSVAGGRTGLEATQSLSAPLPSGARQPAYPGGQVGRGNGEISLLSEESTGPSRPTFEDRGDKVTLNLVNVPIAMAAKAVFSEILKKNFSVSDAISGTVTLQTTRPMSKQALVDTFEAVLSARGYGISRQGDTFMIGVLDGVKTGSVRVSNGGDVSTGQQARIVPLAFTSATEMERIVKSIAPEGVLRVDTQRNMLVLTGTNAELNTMQETITLFDVDWMRGMSASIFPLSSGADPAVLVKQLEALFNAGAEESAGTVKFLPSRELEAILVISPRRVYLDRARTIIARLDNAAAGHTGQTFIYKVENRTAKELAAIVQNSLGNGTAGSSALSALSTPERATMQDGTTDDRLATAMAAGGNGSASNPGNISVVADEANNSLVIVASRRDYDRLLGMLTRLDRMPSQVLIEAVIAEATLDDTLKFGLRYSLGAANVFKFTNDDDGNIANDTSGFTYSAKSTDFRAVLNALSRITDVKVVSSPTLTVLDNRTAKLQIGDQVPTVSESRTSDIGDNTVTKVEMKDTGVILNVTPRISSNGHILLDIDQEVSDVVNTTTSGIDSPTIRQRKVSSTVVIGDGQSIVIGGLVQEKRQKSTDGVPVLGKLPIIGAAFRTRNDIAKRTELMIFIRARVMRDQTAAQTVADEFRSRLNAISLQQPGTASSSTWDLLRMTE